MTTNHRPRRGADPEAFRADWDTPTVLPDGSWRFTGYDLDALPYVGDVPIARMMFPVRCTCGTAYDLAAVEPTGRYLDCTLWNAPCCGRKADDRGETGWKSTRDYTPLRRGRQ